MNDDGFNPVLHSREHRARHETAHAVVGLFYGLGVEHLILTQVDPCGCQPGPHVKWKKVKDSTDPTHIATMFLAGPEMDRRAGLSREDALKRHTQPESDVVLALEHVGSDKIDTLCDVASSIIERHMKAIEAVALELTLRHTMDEDDLLAIAFDADPDLRAIYDDRKSTETV